MVCFNLNYQRKMISLVFQTYYDSPYDYYSAHLNRNNNNNNNSVDSEPFSTVKSTYHLELSQTKMNPSTERMNSSRQCQRRLSSSGVSLSSTIDKPNSKDLHIDTFVQNKKQRLNETKLFVFFFSLFYFLFELKIFIWKPEMLQAMQLNKTSMLIDQFLKRKVLLQQEQCCHVLISNDRSEHLTSPQSNLY